MDPRKIHSRFQGLLKHRSINGVCDAGSMSETQPITVPYVALTGQPAGTPWPTDGWPTGDAPAGAPLGPLLDELFDDTGPLAATYAAVVIHRGRLVAERYAGELERWDGPSEQSGPDTRFLSWSIAKSMLHAVVGMLVGEGRLDLDAPAPVPAWQGPGDPRRAITLQDMLEMRDGLDFVEQYVIGSPSDVIDMLFGSGQQDMAAFTEAKPLAVPPGSRFNYASGTSNVISGIVARLIGRGEAYRSFLHRRLFDPIGMTSALPGFDEVGTWVASSSVQATARDFARFGYLYLRDGTWDGRRLLPEGWVDHGRLPHSVDPEDGDLYGAHWWVVGDEYGSFRASGYEGQSILIAPGLDLVVVRMGKTPTERGPQLEQWRRRMTAAFARN
jgi:CubicO group peptidase (beta-lactamase class C family)